MTENPWIVWVAVTVLAILALGVARALGYFSPNLSATRPSRAEVSLTATLGGFAVVLLVFFLLAPALFTLGNYLVYKETAPSKLGTTVMFWEGLAASLAAVLGLMLFTFWLDRDVRKLIWWGGAKASWRRGFWNAQMGALSLLIALPVVGAVQSSALLIMKGFGLVLEQRQVAVQAFERSLDDPFKAVAVSFAIVVLAPIMEETLYRGLLQSFIRRYTSWRWAVTWSSLIFAGSHFNLIQGLHNIDLTISLFALACFLGFLYERQRSLWAPIVLHSTFNLVNVGVILIRMTK